MDTQVEDVLDRILQEKIVFFIDYFVGKMYLCTAYIEKELSE
ncbi:hypothetical protein HMPREF1551_00474 [Capnocytophaga sp. oral taxon 863 str. F0517]|nr:hypothetical protein [Capnocytophaga sp. oral taxon 863]ERI64236.1 hypothetical protein HMPREF1551_00474 [Capnocytophaga sp. oral taxon 863 str. F0517]